MLLKYFLIAASTFTFLLFTLGIYKLSKDPEPNLCKMTYMFKSPRFSRIPSKHKLYSLYYYSEGNDVVDLKALSGAPVLFVPGNGGSYAQVRSLGSVALRMGYNKPHLDYFTIDFREELTAWYGNYLARQQRFLKESINAILRLYKSTDESVERKIVIIGHSMGGAVAKSILAESKWLKKVAVIIFISTPMDQPVIYVDKNIDYFYQQTNQLQFVDVNKTNVQRDVGFIRNATKVPEVVLISIGGGSRDKLVPAYLTESHLSDIAMISTAIPNVWVPCDHLAVVWCLQLMKVINKFLHAITFKATNGLTLFGTNTEFNLHAARQYFVGVHADAIGHTKDFHAENWTTTKAFSFYKVFEHGISGDEYQHAVLYDNVAPNEQIYIAVTHEATNEPWLFGCQHNVCVENQILTRQILQLPTKRGIRTYVLLNLAAIFSTFINWTHLLIRLGTTKRYADLYIDVHNADERLIAMMAPNWFQFSLKNLNTTTSQQTDQQMFKKLQINNLNDEFYAFKLKFDFAVSEKSTYKNEFETVIRIYAPWAPGYDRYYTFSASQGANHSVLVHLPKYITEAYKSPLYVDIHTDPWCSMNVSYRFALGDTMRNMVQRYYHALPAHMGLIISTSLGAEFRAGLSDKKYADFLQLKSWYFVIAVRLANSAVTKLPFFPQELLESSIKPFSTNASFIVHGFAMACCVFMALGLRLNLYILSRIANKIDIPHVDMPKMHVVFAVVIACISVTCSKCVSLVITLMVYTILVAIANKTVKKSVSENDTTNTADIEHDQSAKKTKQPYVAKKEGFQNLSLHVALLVLILLMLLVNVGDTVAWYKGIIEKNSYHSLQTLSSLVFTPAIFVICCLPLLWHLKVPSNVDGTPIYSVVFNIIAALSLLLCEEKLYRLNYVIAFIVALLILREILSKSLRLIR